MPPFSVRTPGVIDNQNIAFVQTTVQGRFGALGIAVAFHHYEAITFVGYNSGRLHFTINGKKIRQLTDRCIIGQVPDK